MGERTADLHVHTNLSDGTFTPEEAVKHAKSIGLSAIAITDHDTTEGVERAMAEGERSGVEIIPGIELSSELSSGGSGEMHILGYYISWKDPTFQGFLSEFREARHKRALRIVEKLSNLGVTVDPARIFEIAGDGAVGRLHVAKALIEEGAVPNIETAFGRYLGIGKAAYVPKLRLEPEAAINMLLKIGGVPVLAHPYYAHYSDESILKKLVDAGLRGIEVWHTKHPKHAVKRFQEIAEKYHLISTGGSDCHGFSKGKPLIGTVKLPYDHVEKLKQKHDEALKDLNVKS